MRESDLQRLYDESEALYRKRLLERTAGQPEIEKDYVQVRYGDNPGWVATYSGETPRRYLVRLERPIDDPDQPDFGPTTSVWFPASALEPG